MKPRCFATRGCSIAAVWTWAALVCSAALWTASPVFAQEKPGEPSTSKPAAKPVVKQEWQPPRGVRVERDVPYIDGGDEAQRLDLYLPETPSDRPLPLIVHIHGGAWRGGSKFPCPVVGMVGKGYAVASVEYRFSQKALFPAQIKDCQAAIRWLRAHSKQYNFDPDYVGVVGGSAGGHLSALVGTAGGKQAFPKIGGNEEQSDRVQAVCNYFGPANFATVVQQAEDDKHVRNIFKFNTPSDPYSGLIGVSLDADKQKTDAVSPVHFVSKDNPPMLILHGDYDALVPYAQSEELAAALQANGVGVWLQKLPGSGHGGPAFGKPEVIALIQNFFDKHLKGAEVNVELIPEARLAVDPPMPAAK
ncbi:alpha/beta hydrolase [Planctomicrobium piriforme]|uniref:Acetyl esterase/lipase n=1 Tax=Planctomicrobium piriforme TaxID=1576369 RepID=A0A1I3J2V1_9PLAN|nr:alpha/beta hydrolase [Planctomicrobium piriforme]SFI54587.1 Acetyl esterase/lipase [Planctomicrobium piriforme]